MDYLLIKTIIWINYIDLTNTCPVRIMQSPMNYIHAGAKPH
jgi:hypothetical protein